MSELQPYIPTLVVAIVVLLSVIALILIYKLLNRHVRGRKGQRLGITEFHEIDKSRRIVLLRRDNVEHLVMIGGNQDIVIESRIESGLMNDTHYPPRTQSDDHVAMRPPKPAVFGNRRPVLRTVETSMMNDGRGEDEAS